MPATSPIESTLTDRYQTTVPEAVRRVLGLRKRDRIRYLLQPDGQVMLARAEPEADDDPVLERFLTFLADDLTTHPDRLSGIPAGLRERMSALTAGITLDLNHSLSADDE